MLERLLLTVALIGLGVAVYWGLSRRQRNLLEAALPGLENRRPGVALILYFTTPTCIPCKTVQRPALATVQKLMGEQVQLITIDASEQPKVADHWGVMSVPTTYVFDAYGKLLAQNSGVARAEKLLRQVCVENAKPPVIAGEIEMS